MSVFQSVSAVVASAINSRKMDASALRKKAEELISKASAFEIEASSLEEASSELSEESVSELVSSLTARGLSPLVANKTAEAILLESLQLLQPQTDIPALAREGNSRESKGAFEARLIGALSNTSDKTVKILSEELNKNAVQISTALGNLAMQGRVLVSKQVGSRTLLYRLK